MYSGPPVGIMMFQAGVEQLDSPITLSATFPMPSIAMSKKMPQCIAHRGYKAKFPENTLLAFDMALDAGAVALETDLHITKDHVVVLSHDATLKRCFGQEDKILDRNWNEIKDFKTIAAPHEPMPRLRDLLEYLARPGLEDAWLLLDIKLDNDAETIMRLIGSTVAEVQPSSKPWSERIVLGLWAAKYLPLAARYLPGFPVMHIGFHLPYASQFLTVPNVGFNMSLPMMMAPGGSRFVRECQQKHRRQLLAWTVNDRDRMEWCIRRKFDGVITDDPSLFIEACERHEEDKPEPWFPVSFKASLEIIRIYVMITTLFYLFRRPLGSKGMPPLIERIPKRA